VLPYDPNWPRLYEQEIALLTPIFESSNGVSSGNSESLAEQEYGNSKGLASLVIWHHIGSTSVPALAAKPIIDIILEVPEIEKLGSAERQDTDSLKDGSLAFALHKLGYEHMGEYNLPGRRYFRKLDGVRLLVHIHAYQIGNPEITRHLAFRDYLRAHPDVANQYASIKLALVAKFPDNPRNYQTAKDTYVEEAERIALDWYGNKTGDST